MLKFNIELKSRQIDFTNPFESYHSCDYEVGTEWTDSSGMCNAIYGNFEGNTDNLHQLMRHHFRESFRFLLMGSIFDTDEVNRMGIHGYLREDASSPSH